MSALTLGDGALLLFLCALLVYGVSILDLEELLYTVALVGEDRVADEGLEGWVLVELLELALFGVLEKGGLFLELLFERVSVHFIFYDSTSF